MRGLFGGIVAIVLLSAPARGDAQVIADVLGMVRDGGGWVGIPIQTGVGTYRSGVLPTMGLSLNGCVQVAPGHSGDWKIAAHDRVTRDDLLLEAVPGVGVPFAHTFGLQAQIDFEIRWSEPRDTTLVLWVGLALGTDRAGAPCEPGSGSR